METTKNSILNLVVIHSFNKLIYIIINEFGLLAQPLIVMFCILVKAGRHQILGWWCMLVPRNLEPFKVTTFIMLHSTKYTRTTYIGLIIKLGLTWLKSPKNENFYLLEQTFVYHLLNSSSPSYEYETDKYYVIFSPNTFSIAWISRSKPYRHWQERKRMCRRGCYRKKTLWCKRTRASSTPPPGRGCCCSLWCCTCRAGRSRWCIATCRYNHSGNGGHRGVHVAPPHHHMMKDRCSTPAYRKTKMWNNFPLGIKKKSIYLRVQGCVHDPDDDSFL